MIYFGRKFDEINCGLLVVSHKFTNLRKNKQHPSILHFYVICVYIRQKNIQNTCALVVSYLSLTRVRQKKLSNIVPKVIRDDRSCETRDIEQDERRHDE